MPSAFPVGTRPERCADGAQRTGVVYSAKLGTRDAKTRPRPRTRGRPTRWRRARPRARRPRRPRCRRAPARPRRPRSRRRSRRPRKPSGVTLARDGRAVDARDHVGAARDREHRQHEHRLLRRAGGRDRDAPHGTAHSTARPWRRDAAGPSARQRREERAGRDRREQQAVERGPPPSRSASAGNSARGMPNTIARKSMPNMLMMTECPRRKRRPFEHRRRGRAARRATTGAPARSPANTASATQ